MTLHTKQGGTWSEVASGDLYTKQGGVWEQVTFGYTKQGGVWEQFYVLSDPVTYKFRPTAINSTTGFGTTWNGSGDSKIGSYGFGDRVSYMEFMTSVDISGSGLTLAEAIAIRPVVDACTFELKRTVGGSSTINAGEYYISWNDGGFGSGTGTNEATFRNTADLTSAGWAQNSARQFTGLGDLATKLTTNSISVCNNLSPVTSGGGNDADYTQISGTLIDHALYVVLDYV